VDAPVSGGKIGAEAGTLTAMCGGLPDSVAAAEIYLRPVVAEIISTGGPSTGQAAKMINNMLLFINLAGVGEGVALAERLGLDLRMLYDIVSASSGDSWPLRKWFPVAGVVETAPANQGFAASFPAEGAVKDVRLEFDYPEAAPTTTWTRRRPPRWASQPRQATGRPELTEAAIVVSGGRGTGGNFEPVEKLADALRIVCRERGLVSAGGYLP